MAKTTTTRKPLLLQNSIQILDKGTVLQLYTDLSKLSKICVKNCPHFRYNKRFFTEFTIGDKSSQNLELESKNHSTLSSKTKNLQDTISIPHISMKEVSQPKNSLKFKDQNGQPKTEAQNNSKFTGDTKSKNHTSNDNQHLTKVCDQKVIFVERGTHQVIKSPNFPQKSQSNLNCTWTLSTVRNDERVRLVFDSLDIGANGDRLILYDGDSTESENLMTGPMDQVKFGQNK